MKFEHDPEPQVFWTIITLLAMVLFAQIALSQAVGIYDPAGPAEQIVVPWTANLNQALIKGLEPDKTYYAKVSARDEAGNIASYQTLMIRTTAGTVNMSPVVKITAPLNGALITSNPYTIKAEAQDDSGDVASLGIYINGVEAKQPCACKTTSFSWKTPSYKGRLVKIMVRAIDADGLVTEATVEVMVKK